MAANQNALKMYFSISCLLLVFGGLTWIKLLLRILEQLWLFHMRDCFFFFLLFSVLSDLLKYCIRCQIALCIRTFETAGLFCHHQSNLIMTQPILMKQISLVLGY